MLIMLIVNLNRITLFIPDFSCSFTFVFVGLIVLQIISSASDTPYVDLTICFNKFLYVSTFSSGTEVVNP